VDAAIREDIITVFGFIARHNEYPSAYSFRPESEELVRLWRPQVLDEGGKSSAESVVAAGRVLCLAAPNRVGARL